jgi:hypothetical protein
MGVRGAGELSAELPPAAASCIAAVEGGLDEILELRHAPLAPGQVRALTEALERVSARVEAARLAGLAAIDAREDVVPAAAPGHAAAVFALHVLGRARVQARRDAHTAALLRPQSDGGDLPRIGAALRAGDITAGHVQVAVRAHRDLGPAVRDTLVPYQDLVAEAAAPMVVDGRLRPDPAVTDDLAAAFTDLLTDPSSPSGAVSALGAGAAFGVSGSVRWVLLVDAVLASYARRLDVDSLEAVARRIVDHLNPKTPTGAHERRFLHLSRQFDGSWRGRFECGAAQGAFIKAVLAAVAVPRPGVGIDADGVQHTIPDDRDPGALRMDATVDLFAAALIKNGILLPNPTDADADADADHDHDHDRCHAANANAGPAANDAAPSGHGTGGAERAPGSGDEPPEPPQREGEEQVVREPGVLTGPLPNVELIVGVGIDHLAAAHALHLTDTLTGSRPGEGVPVGIDLLPALQDWLSRQTWHQAPPDRPAVTRRAEGTDDDPPDGPLDVPLHDPLDDSVDVPLDDSVGDRCAWRLGEQLTAAHHPGNGDGSSAGAAVAGLARALSASGRQARVEHAGPVDPATVRFLADCAQLRVALLSPDGAVLHLGRSQRLVSPAQKRALIARDAGCVIPGCTVTADACQAHHVTAWTDGGPTNLDNLSLLCLGHHIEITTAASSRTDGNGWHIEMVNGVPWVRPPSWIDPARPLLRNSVHHPAHERSSQP